MPEAGTNNDDHYVDYGDSVRVGGDRNWRNNNPGNIEAGQYANDHGAEGDDGRFAIFPDHQTGMNALVDLLGSDTYQGMTLGEAIEHYAPPDENDTANYTSLVEQGVGVDASTPMSDLTADQINSLAETIESIEGGHEGDTYQAGDPDAPQWVTDLLSDDSSSSSDSGDTSSDSSDDNSDSGDSQDSGPQTDPTPQPGPTPDPVPDPGPAPTPDPDPMPDPTPDPSPGPSPDPDPGPSDSGGDSSGDSDAGDHGGGGGDGGGDGGGEG